MFKSKIVTIILIILILLTIPVGVYLLSQNLNPQKRAYTGVLPDNQDKCKKVEVSVSESPSCPKIAEQNGPSITIPDPNARNEVIKYAITVSVKNITDKPINSIDYQLISFYCTEPYGQYDPRGWLYCVGNPDSNNATVQTRDNLNLAPGESTTFTVERTNPNNQACGTFQLDFKIDGIDGDSSCVMPHTPNYTVAAWGICQTGAVCTEITPTVSPTVEPTVTPTVSPTPTNTPTPTPSICVAVKPEVPKNLRVEVQANEQCKVSWDTVKNASGYFVSWGKQANGEGSQPANVGQDGFVTVSCPDLDKYTYYFKVKAVNECAEGDFSGVVHAGYWPTPTPTEIILIQSSPTPVKTAQTTTKVSPTIPDAGIPKPLMYVLPFAIILLSLVI